MLSHIFLFLTMHIKAEILLRVVNFNFTVWCMHSADVTRVILCRPNRPNCSQTKHGAKQKQKNVHKGIIIIKIIFVYIDNSNDKNAV